MHISDLLMRFPWIKHPIVLSFAKSFTEKQWVSISSSGINDLIKDNSVDDRVIANFFLNFQEVLEDSKTLEALKSVEHSYEEILNNIKIDILQEYAIRCRKNERRKEPRFTTSAIFYLQNAGFSTQILIDFFNYDLTLALKASHKFVQILTETELTLEQALDKLESFWKTALHPYTLLYADGSKVKDILDFLSSTLTYKQYCSVATPANAGLFKPNPSQNEFFQFQEEIKKIKEFFLYCQTFMINNNDFIEKVDLKLSPTH